MPVEFEQLYDKPYPIDQCPNCMIKPFKPMMRGMIQRKKKLFFFFPTRPYCAVICARCKDIVDWEKP